MQNKDLIVKEWLETIIIPSIPSLLQLTLCAFHLAFILLSELYLAPHALVMICVINSWQAYDELWNGLHKKTACN